MRIEFESVKFRNFFSFGNRWSELTFEPGINLVLGKNYENDKSNGSGKSSAFEPIPFALFGRTHKGVNLEDVINWVNRRECEVRLKFTKDNYQYEIRRGLKPHFFEIYEDGRRIPPPSLKKDYQQQLEEEILGFNFQTFMSLIHTNINSSLPILAMKKPEKRMFIEKVFRLFVYSQLHKRCNDHEKTCDNKAHEARMEIDFNSKSIDDIQKRVRELTRKIESLDISIEELDEEKKALHNHYAQEEIKSKFKELNEEKVKLEDSLTIYHSRSSFFQNKQLLFKTKAEGIHGKIKDVTKSIKEAKKNVNKLEEWKEKWGDLEAVKSRKEALHIDIAGLTTSLIDDGKAEERFRSNIASAAAQCLKLKKQIETIKDKEICPTCEEKIEGKRVLSKLTTKLERREKETDSAKAELEKVKEESDKRVEEKRKLDKELLTLQRSYEEYLLIPKESPELLIKELEELRRKAEKHDKAASKFEKFHSKYGNLSVKIAKQLKIVNDELGELRKPVEKFLTSKKQIELIDQKLELLEQNRKDALVAKEQEEERIEKLKRSTVNLNQKIKKATEIKDYFTVIKDICRDENIKQYAISWILPYLNQGLNRYLSLINYNFYVILQNWLEPIIKGPGINFGSYKNLSSGEKKAVDLSLQFALLDITRDQAKILPDIYIIDELLDGSVDAHSLTELLKIVKTKQMEDNLKFYIISHRPEVEEIEIDNTYRIEKRNRFSLIEKI